MFRKLGVVLGVVAVVSSCQAVEFKVDKNGNLPVVDLDKRTDLQVVVDKEKGQYLGHPTTVLLDDGKTILITYPKGHGRGAIVYKRSTDGGKTWSERLPTPKNWASSREVPTLYPLIDKNGKKRLVMFSGCGPKNRIAYSEDEGKTWSALTNIENQKGGIVAMSDCIALKEKGHYMATYHRRTKNAKQRSQRELTLYTCFTKDGGLTWSDPVGIHTSSEKHLCEGGFVRSPDGNTIALLLRENSRRHNSQIMFSSDEGKTWTKPRAMPKSLNGDRHQSVYLPDGRLFIQFRRRSVAKKTYAPTEGDWIAWVGTWDDLESGKDGQYIVRLKDNQHGWDCAYPAAELLEDGTLVCTTYGHWITSESPYILTLRFKIDEIDKLAEIAATKGSKVENNMGKNVNIYDPNNPELIRKNIEKK